MTENMPQKEWSDLAEGGPDKNVEAVVARLRSRAEKGFRKYGVTTERKDLSLTDWLRHLQEELLDAAVYIEASLPPPPETSDG